MTTPCWLAGSVTPLLLVMPVASALHRKPDVGGQFVFTQLRKLSSPAWAAAVASPESTVARAGRIWVVSAVVAVVSISVAMTPIMVTNTRLWPESSLRNQRKMLQRAAHGRRGRRCDGLLMTGTPN